MKFVLTLSLILSLPAFADEYFTGASDVKVERDFDLNEGDYFVGSSELKDKSRSLASEKQKEELSMKDDAYFTGSSY